MINFTLKRFTKALGLASLTFSGLLLNAQTQTVNWDWTLAGPVYNAGRIRNMVVDNSNPSKLYAGSTTSGLFVSNNSGIKWAPINDQDSIKNISYIAQATDGTLYAATGEGFLREGQRAKSQPGTGLYKLVGTGLVSVAPQTVLGTIINRIACGPSGQIAVAGNNGVLVSLGGGAFTQVTLPGASTHSLAMGQDVKFDANGILYCTFGTSYGTSNAGTATKIYKSTDASLTSFTNITPFSTVLGNDLYGRVELAIAPSNNNVIYASCSNKYVNDLNYPPSLKGLFVSYDAGSTWGLVLQGSPQLDPLTDGSTTASGDYAHVIMVSASNPDVLFFGGYSLFIYQRTGGSNTNPVGVWVQPSQQFVPTFQNYVHQNIHDIKFVPGTPNKFFFVTDAGIYRSTDLSAITQTLPPSFQPFYRDLITGQYNSVSIERYPWSDYDELIVDTMNKGKTVGAYAGFVGGTGGNGVTYFSGGLLPGDTAIRINEEVSYLSGDVYATEYSKISYNSAIIATGNGRLYRAPDVRKSAPVNLNINAYSGPLQKLSVVPSAFENPSYTVTGTPFKFWENYGQASIAPDSISFYNDTIRALASMNGVQELTTTATFSFSTVRPNKFALIDSIAIRTGTVILPSGTPSLNVPFTKGQLITMKLKPNYPAPTPTTILTGTDITTTGPVSTVKDPTVSLNTTILNDVISVTFDQPPFASQTASSSTYDYAAYYKVFATIYYKYKAGDTLTVVDNNISSEVNTYKLIVPQNKSLNWNYGSWPSYTITANTTPSLTAVSNASYMLTSTLVPNTQTQTSPVFTVNPYSTSTTYTIDNLGIFSMAAKQVTYQVKGDPITYTLTGAPGATSDYTLTAKAGNAAATTLTQSSNVFVVAPTSTATTDYTIAGASVANTFSSAPGSTFVISPNGSWVGSQSSNTFNVIADTVSTFTITQTTSLTTQNTFSTVGGTDYVLNPGAITQTANPVFTVNVTSGGAYTLTGVSSNTAIGANTSIVYSPRAIRTITFSMVPFAKNNSRLKVPMKKSSRLAFFFKANQITGATEAVMVSKNALSLNDPISAIRLSQTGCFTDDANGNPTFNTISITGKPTMLEWSKSGTELYYSTAPTTTSGTHNLYRVSHIYDIMDYSSNSYSGKFATDVFTYGSNGVGTSANVSTVSPFRTTLVGQFDKPITSIVVSNDNKGVMVTLNNPTATPSSTSGGVMYSDVADIRTTINPVTGWKRKDAGLSRRVVNCSMIEQNSNMAVVGTDIGVFFTNDITASNPTWVNVNTQITNAGNQLPRVEIFDIKQQTMKQNECFNSGQIYVATNGRGVWSNNAFFKPTYVGINEYETKVSQGNNLLLYPNPTSNEVNIVFNASKEETATVQIMDISGRLIQTELIGNLQPGDVKYSFDTRNLNSGVYIVNISSTSGVKRVSKLIVTK
ncbi:MAG: T9SS type A sorting domain-containing protein [Bacteroidia bacterium]|nr:T9SS type A sorting domain-containing protein [Bacteroidia bacterium]